MITSSAAIKVINAGLGTGADYAEIYIEKTVSNSIALENGKVEVAGKSITYGAGIRLLKKYQSVYGYTNDVSLKGLTSLAETLSKRFNGKQELTVDGFKLIKPKQLSSTPKPMSSISKEEKIKLCKEASDIISSYDPRIVRTNVSIIDYKKEVEIYNTKGKHVVDSKERGRMALMATAADKGELEYSFTGPGASDGFDFFTDKIDVKEKALNVAKTCIKMLEAKECPSGKMPVIIGNAFGGCLFHEACGHPLEASAVSRGLSVFANKEGQQIASSIVTAVDDGTIENAWGSNNIDDEGNPTQRTVLIENGILKSYLIDDFNGRRMGKEGNGACRRQNYKYEPTSRMSNTFICNGTSTVEDIIKATKLGLYAKGFNGGQVNPSTGEFNFGCSEAYIIRDGKICEPVRGATLIGKGEEILPKIDMIANDLERGQGMCGAGSGSIPTDVGQPTLRISEMSVGGRGGELK